MTSADIRVMPPVVTLVKGGLGNQLFCYAAARALALRLGRPLALDITTGYRRDDYGRSYRLGRFPIQAEVAPPEWCLGGDTHSWRHRLARSANKLLPLSRRSYLAEKRRHGTALLTMANPPTGRRVYLNGYWQDEGYFGDRAERIRTELTPPCPSDERNHALGLRLQKSESVFLHVRRVRYPHALGPDYHQAAIECVRTKLKKPVFVLFGDDLRWPLDRLDFHGCEVEVVDHNGADEMADLWLMTCCRHAITANSSFSWWGAWLGGPASEHRLVIAPEEGGVPLVPAKGWQRLPSRLDTAPSG